MAGAPSAFQRWFNQELGDFLGSTCSAYVDDVLVISNEVLANHWDKINQVLERLDKVGLKLDPQEYEFAKKEIKYLGFVINFHEVIKVDPGKIRAIASWETPATSRKLVVSWDSHTSIVDLLKFCQHQRTFARLNKERNIVSMGGAALESI